MSDGLVRMIEGLSAERRAKLASLLHISNEPIAVLGMSCRFPGGVNDPEAYWDLLADGVDAIRDVPADRWDTATFYDPDPQAAGKMYTRQAGFLDQVDQFDASFFGISPREAARMDPQQRLFLEVAWDALEDAGQPVDALAGSAVGVFAGVCASDYGTIQFRNFDELDAYVATGNAHSIVANRLSYHLDFVGPSVAVDTACSSSLVAVHMACRSLRAGESSLAVVGGVHLILSPIAHIIFSKAQMLAPDGRCKAFDSTADGFARGEGCGVVILKRLADAIADHDPIRAVIHGTAINQDGRSNGLMAPSGRAQQACIHSAMKDAGLSPGQIGYVEAHGTGTALGDPIEVEALGEVFGPPRSDGSTCPLGSVKTNIGHLEGAAGIAGLIKVVLALEHGAIPPNLHFRTLNPNIDLDRTPFVIPTRLLPWPGSAVNRYAGVSSFGFGGTNAHVLLGQAPVAPEIVAAEPTSPQFHLLAVSARADDSLRHLAERYRALLSASAVQSAGSLRLHDVCYTANVRRSHHAHRLGATGRDNADMIARLDDFLAGRSHPDLATGVTSRHPGVVFVYSGQGGQWAGMGRALAMAEPVFRSALRRCADAVESLVPWSLLEELAAEGQESRLDETAFGQLAVFAIQVALTELLRSWGVKPDAVVGHSLGEVAAAHGAGALSLEDAALIVVRRSLLMQRLTGQGAMVAVELSAEDAAHAVARTEGRVSVAAVNAHRSVVLSGDGDAIASVTDTLRVAGVTCRPLRARYAFHSAQLDTMRAELVHALGDLVPRRPEVPFYSTVTGGRLDDEYVEATYWAANMRSTVLFEPTITALLNEGYGTFVELGPHPELGAAISHIADDSGRTVTVHASLRRGQDDQLMLRRTAAALYAAGNSLDGAALYPSGSNVRLPRYPWRQERHWFQPAHQDSTRHALPGGPNQHPLLGTRVAAAVREIVYQAQLHPNRPAFLGEHRLYELVVVPAVAYVEMALAAAARWLGDGLCALEEVQLFEPLILDLEGSRLAQTTLLPDDTGQSAQLRVLSTAADGGEGDNWTLHTTGRVLRDAVRPLPHWPEQPHQIRSRLHDQIPVESFYAATAALGFSYGPAFRGLVELWRGESEALGRVDLTGRISGDHTPKWSIHPCVLEGCLQVVGGLASDAQATTGDAYIPISIDRLAFHCDAGLSLWSHARLRAGAEGVRTETIVCDVTLLDDEGRVVADIVGLVLKRAPRRALERLVGNATDNWLYNIEWHSLGGSDIAPRLAEHSAEQADCWLVVGDCDPDTQAVLDAFHATGRSTTLATPGTSYREVEPGRFEVDLADPASVAVLMASTFDARQRCGGVLHLASAVVDMQIDLEADGTSILAAQEAGCRVALNLVQALAASATSAPTRLWLITRGAQAVGNPVGPAGLLQSSMWGFGLTVALEFPDLWGGLVDLAPGNGIDAEALVAEVLGPGDEKRVALRDGARLGGRLARSQLRRHAATPVRLRQDASYLITGGLGGLGSAVAKMFAEHSAGHLILMGRHAPSHRVDTVLDEIRGHGAQVTIVCGDVSNAEDVARVVASIPPAAPLAGVVHAAGTIDDGVLQQQSWDRFESVFRPKLAGAWELHRQTHQSPLDFFVLFSSAAGLFGSPGQANYAAANSFLDALAHLRHAAGLPATSIAWGPWAEVGMAAAVAAADGRPAWRDATMIQPDDGLRLLDQMLGEDTAYVAVLPVDRVKLDFVLPGSGMTAFLSDLTGTADAQTAAAAQPDMLKVLRGTAVTERHEVLSAYLTDQCLQVLGLNPAERPDMSKGFFDMGMDSLMALELKNRVQAAIGYGVPATVIFEHPTITELSSYLIEELLRITLDDAERSDSLDTVIARASTMSAENLAANVDPRLLDEVSQLSEAEIDAELARLMRRDRSND